MQATSELTLFELFKMGGIFMWPLLAFSILTVSIAAERIFFIFFRCNLRVSDIMAEVDRCLNANDFDGARKFLKKQRKKRTLQQPPV
jgi:biopolymer transport protein ExbB